MINPQLLELPMSRTNFYGTKGVRAIEVCLYLILSYLQTKTGILGNSVDPDEMTRNEPSHQYLPCLPFSFR